MKTKGILASALALGLVLTPAVIGRFDGVPGKVPGLEVLMGFGVVATLAAFITLEYRSKSHRVLRTRRSSIRLQACEAQNDSKLVVLPVRDERMAA